MGAALLAVVATACPPPGGGTGSYTKLFGDAEAGNFPTSASQRSMSADGRYVVFRTYDAASAGSAAKVFDRVAGTTTTMKEFAPPYTGPYSEPIISADGSTAYFTGPTGPAPSPRLVESGIYRYRVATGELDSFDLPVDPGNGYPIAAEELTTDGTGSKVGFMSLPRDRVWTEDGGFQELAFSPNGQRWVRPTGMSRNGRYLTRNGVVQLPDDGDPANGRPERIFVEVLDLVEGDVQVSWTSGVRTVYSNPFGPDPWDMRMGTTLDDGSVLFTYNSNAGVFLLSEATGVPTQVAGYQSVTLQGGSWNGRYVSYVGPSSIVPALGNVNELVDRTTGGVTRVSGSADPRLTLAAAVSDSGRYVLLRSSESDRVPSGPGVYLWDRGA